MGVAAERSMARDFSCVAYSHIPDHYPTGPLSLLLFCTLLLRSLSSSFVCLRVNVRSSRLAKLFENQLMQHMPPCNKVCCHCISSCLRRCLKSGLLYKKRGPCNRQINPVGNTRNKHPCITLTMNPLNNKCVTQNLMAALLSCAGHCWKHALECHGLLHAVAAAARLHRLLCQCADGPVCRRLCHWLSSGRLLR